MAHGTEDKVTSHTASEGFHDKISAEIKRISLFTGGYHELHNEPDGVKEKLANEVVAFIEEHSSKAAASVVTEEESKATEASSEPIPVTEASIQPTGVSAPKSKM